MKLRPPKIKINSQGLLSKFKSKRFNKSIDDIQAKENLLRKFLRSKPFRVFLVSFLTLVAVIEVVFAVLIYGFKMENKVTSFAGNIFPYPVAVANQDFVLYGDYIKEKAYIHHFYQATQQADLDFKSIDKEILNQLIENKLIAYQALRNNIKVTNEEVDASVNQIVEQNGGQEKVDKALDELYGINLRQFKSLVRTQLLREKVSNQLIMRVTASHILLRVDKDAPEAKVAEVKAKIDNIKKEIEGGLDFAEAAKKYSEDVGSAEQGGKLEPFAPGEMVEEFSRVAFSTPVGKISDPVRTEFGWHIIRVEAKTGKIEKSFNDWLTELKNKSVILHLIK